MKILEEEQNFSGHVFDSFILEMTLVRREEIPYFLI